VIYEKRSFGWNFRITKGIVILSSRKNFINNKGVHRYEKEDVKEYDG